LSNALNRLPESAGVGLLLFPNMNTVPNHNDSSIPPVVLPVESCVNAAAMVPPAPLGSVGSAQRAALAQALTNAYVGGGTPTNDALAYAFTMGLTPAGTRFSYLNPSVVIITDGQPTIQFGCAGTGSAAYPVDWHPLVDTIASISYSTPPIPTFIIGTPGSEAQSFTGADGRPWLSMAARLGGSAQTTGCLDSGPNYCHYDLSPSIDFATDLAAALGDIVGRAAPCSLALPALPNGLQLAFDHINVLYKQNVVVGTPTVQWLVGRTLDPTCAAGTSEGWYSSGTANEIVLCPNTCARVHADKYAAVQIVGGCAPL